LESCCVRHQEFRQEYIHYLYGGTNLPVAQPSSSGSTRDSGAGTDSGLEISCFVTKLESGSGVGEGGGGGSVSAAFFGDVGGASPNVIELLPPGGFESLVLDRVRFISVLIAVDIFEILVTLKAVAIYCGKLLR